MAKHADLDSLSTVAQLRSTIAELVINIGYPSRKHSEYLPYPDNNFNDPFDESHPLANQYTVAHIYDRDGRAFVPNVSVHIQSIVAERTDTISTKFPNLNWYHVTIQHGPFEWTICKLYQDFNGLHNSLMTFVQSETRRSISTLDEVQEKNNEWPYLPIFTDKMTSVNDNIDSERCQILRDYLNKILRHSKFRNHPATCEFFEVSCLSFVRGLAISLKEGYLLKQSSGDHHGYSSVLGLPFVRDSCKFHHRRKWFTIKDSFVIYIRRDTSEVRFPMLVDHGFEVSNDSHNSDTHQCIKIANLQQTLKVKCNNFRDYGKWMQSLNVLKEQAYCFLSDSANRFNSFAPIRHNQLGYWFINGKSYMESIAKAIQLAKEEIFIADWWLSPEIMLTRPTDDDWIRLDDLLGKVADDGIRVYVMIFKELTLVNTKNSAHTEQALISKSKKGNIKVIRHPDQYRLDNKLLWSHHEKILIIDQKIAFSGGIDLCFGRWDDEFHRLVDLGKTNDAISKMAFEIAQDRKEIDDKVMVGMVEQEEEKFAKSTDEIRATTCLLDESIEVTTELRILDDGNRSIRQSSPSARKWHPLTKMMRDAVDEEKSTESQPIMDTKKRYFIGKDYINLYEKKIDAVEKYYEDYIDRTTVPRMPWHDEALVVFGEVARDAARHFIQRWNIHKYQKFPNNKSYPFLLPKTYDDKEELAVNNWKEFINGEPYKIDAQCVRSVGPWSAGTRTTEISIQNAYIEMIANAKYFIYIENQFFVTIANDSVIHNQLADALYQRVLRAHTSREKFRIYILLPLLPGYNKVNMGRVILHFIMRSIIKGDQSLFKRLEAAGVSPSDYISFFGMRQHGILMDKLITEIVYIHSKLMIIDDRMAICGSANINDRSLLGQRDSEFCVVVHDIEEEDCLFDGQSVRVGKFCSSWRRRLFSMLLGTMWENKYNIDVSDPVSDEFYHYFRQVARTNTLIYEEVFATLPTDRVRRFKEVSDYTERPKLKDTDPDNAKEKLNCTRGLVVEYPLYFLDEDDDLPSFLTSEGLTPHVLWV